MTGLLEMREKLKLFYSKNEVFIMPIAKLLLAFVTLTVLNGRMGYMDKVDKLPIVLVAALFCSFLPIGFIIFFAVVFSLLHMYALGIEVALLALCLYLILLLLFFRFSQKDSLVLLLTVLLFAFKIPYIMPIAVGLLGTPVSIVSVSCGVVVYYFFNHVIGCSTAISSMEDGEFAAKLKLLIDGLLENREMLVIIAAFAVTIIAVYLIRRMQIDYSWTIAMVTGGIVNLVLLLVGDLIFDANMSVGGAIMGILLAIGIAKILEFFRFCVDYSRTEKVQFEDDEYYYYVKAIPKMTVAAQSKTVKKINTQRRTAVPGENNFSKNSSQNKEHLTRNSTVSHTVGRTPDFQTSDEFEDEVVTERTSFGRSSGHSTDFARTGTKRSEFARNRKAAKEKAKDDEFDFDYNFEDLE